MPDLCKSIELRWLCSNLHQGRSSLLSSCPEINGINQLTNCFSCLPILFFSFSFFNREHLYPLSRQLMCNSLSFHSPYLTRVAEADATDVHPGGRWHGQESLARVAIAYIWLPANGKPWAPVRSGGVGRVPVIPSGLLLWQCVGLLHIFQMDKSRYTEPN